jgi:hypothetical protein
LTVSDILDGALRAWKLAPATIVGVTAVFVVPAQVLLGIVNRNSFGDVDLSQTFGDAFTATGPSDVETGFGGDLFLLGLLVQGIALALVTAAVSRLVTGWYTGRRLDAGALLGGAVYRSWALVVAWVLVHLVEGVFAILLFLPALVPMTWYSIVSVVVACEGVGPIKAMRRSFRLTSRRFGSVLLVCLLVVLVDILLSGALTAIGALYVEVNGPAGWAVNTAVAAAALLVTTPFVAGAATLLYLDLRVRTEGLDIELAAGRRFATVA